MLCLNFEDIIKMLIFPKYCRNLILIPILILILPNSIHTENAKEQESGAPDFAIWKSIQEKLDSSNSAERLDAVKQAVRYKSEDVANLLHERITLEKNEEIIFEILKYFKLRHSRTDFFFILEFIRKSLSLETAAESWSVMRLIYEPRTRVELSAMLTEKKWKIHMIAWMLSSESPDSDEIKFTMTAARRYDIFSYMLLYARKTDFIGLLKKYNFPDSMPPITASEYYWALKGKFKISAGFWDYYRPDMLLEVPDSVSAEFATLLYENAPVKPDEKLFMDNDHPKLNFVLLNNRFKNGVSDEWKKFLSSGNSPEFIMAISRNYNQLTDEEKMIFDRKCGSNEYRKIDCDYAFISANDAKGRKIWELKSPVEKEEFFKRNSVMLFNRGILNEEDYRQLLTSENRSVRLIAWLSITPEEFIKMREFLVCLSATETDRMLRTLFISKMTSPEYYPKIKPFKDNTEAVIFAPEEIEIKVKEENK